MLEGKTAVVTGGIREMMEPIINAIPLGRMGQPEKISSAFLFCPAICRLTSQRLCFPQTALP